MDEALVIFIAQIGVTKPGRRDETAAIITNGLFIGASIVVGRVVGWLLGAFICRE